MKHNLDQKREIKTIVSKMLMQQENIIEGMCKIQMLLDGPGSMQNEGPNDPYQHDEEI